MWEKGKFPLANIMKGHSIALQLCALVSNAKAKEKLYTMKKRVFKGSKTIY